MPHSIWTTIDEAIKSRDIEIVKFFMDQSETLKFLSTSLYIKDENNTYLDRLEELIYKYRNKIEDIIPKVDSLYNSLKNNEKAYIIYKELVEQNPTLIKNKIIKDSFERHQFLIQSPVMHIDNPEFAQENIRWLGNRMFLEHLSFPQAIYKLLDDLGVLPWFGLYIPRRNNIKDVLIELKENAKFKEVLDISALNIIHNKDLYIGLVNLSGNSGSYNNFKQKVNIDIKPDFKNDFKGTLIHELWHLAMYKVFKNQGFPYEVTDQFSKHVYQLVISKVLENINEKSCHLDHETNFQETWIFGQKLASHYFDSKCEIENPVITSILDIYNLYESSEEGLEFIVRYEEQVASNASLKELEILYPLKNYINYFVKPAMREYVIHHPMMHLLEGVDKIYDTVSNNQTSNPEMCSLGEIEMILAD